MHMRRPSPLHRARLRTRFRESLRAHAARRGLGLICWPFHHALPDVIWTRICDIGILTERSQEYVLRTRLVARREEHSVTQIDRDLIGRQREQAELDQAL